MASADKQSGKKRAHYVPSRYKQAAEKVSSLANSSREKTFLKASGSNSQSKENSCDSANYSKLCVSQASSEHRGMTSTPASKGEFAMLSLDASVVTDYKGCISVPLLKESIRPLPADKIKRNILKKNKHHDEPLVSSCPVIVIHKDNKITEHYNEKVAEAHADILYAEYLQAAYLDFQSKKALERRCSSALEKLYKLFSLVIIHLKKLQSEQSQVKALSYLLKVLIHAKKQEEIYTPLFEVMPELEMQYTSLAKAVNATKHKLQVKGVLIPELENGDEIIKLLEETSDTISGFFRDFKKLKEIGSSAENLGKYMEVAEKISDSLNKGTELLAEAEDLLLSETSLELSHVSLKD